MKILLTGKDGQLGFELVRALAPLGEVAAIGRADCDLGDAEALRALVRRIAPELIVNPAAYTAVDKAEAERDAAFAINARVPGILGEEAARLGALVVHYSTDYVFDGAGQAPYTEADPAAPQSVYGSSKLAGERALAQACPRHLILRTSWVVGTHGGNFAKTMLRLAAERDHLTVVDDQFGAPTSAALLADLTAHLVRQYTREGKDGFPYGTYHVAATGETSWCDYARFVLGSARDAGSLLRAGPGDVLPVKTAAYPTAAKRPSNSRLDTSLFRRTFGLRLPPWQEGVRQVLRHILPRENDV
ncbi:dTDP-4-dehydrorhamnose reductase [Massilia sp. WF1]|uniref:dTDP-4-dehydrorhamnose reductase n=1 Tax=unclassified Massilia TaxID=2609279 RepID=UPI0006498017|nr:MULTISPECIES: dTDP-4-dehydrorhamnose reductase [unclassified Massilia]ALK98557.1 dTDP-4-dehydrorhamnose reductase [Massilia sp. WG5]KLU35929.1 dTDP-4-dehydrorhamnose reductase [Massilia sp. WF1]